MSDKNPQTIWIHGWNSDHTKGLASVEKPDDPEAEEYVVQNTTLRELCWIDDIDEQPQLTPEQVSDIRRKFNQDFRQFNQDLINGISREQRHARIRNIRMPESLLRGLFITSDENEEAQEPDHEERRTLIEEAEFERNRQ